MSATTTLTPSADPASYLGADPGLDRLYDNIQTLLPGVTLPLIKLHAWNAIEEFYLRSTCRREIVSWQMAVGVGLVDFDPFDDTWRVAWVLDLWGLPRVAVSQPGCIADTNSAFTSVRSGQALLALKPASFTSGLPAELFSHWFETLLAGTLSRLQAMPGRPWSDLKLAEYHQRRFMTGMLRARDIANRGFTDGVGRWAYPAFARGRRGFCGVGRAGA